MTSSAADPTETQRALAEPIDQELTKVGFADVTLVGKGGFGAVYRGIETSLDRTVAIKVLDPNHDDDDLTRFLREQRAMGRLSGHPNIVGVLHVDVTSRGEPYIVMPYHARGSILDRIKRAGPMGTSDCLRLGIKIAGALETAHATAILHRDIKPANILVSAYGEPQLADFGISRIAGAFETSARVITASPAFSAPEVLIGEPPTVASDIYGLAATLFYTLTGHPAYERRPGERGVTQFLRIVERVHDDLNSAAIPPELTTVIAQAMAPDGADRQKSAADFGRHLQRVQEMLGYLPDIMVIPEAATASDSVLGAPATEPAARGPYRHSADDHRPTGPSIRFRPPAPARRTVVRNRLIEALESRGARRLTLIHGPAGFGKSTLAAQFRDKLLATGSTVAWLTVDENDCNRVSFLTHLVDAAARVEPDLVAGLIALLQQFGADAEPEVLGRFIDQIPKQGNGFALIIDDWHRIAASPATGILEMLLDSDCPELQLVITSRTLAGLPIGRLRLRDELTEIDAAAMRFDVDETRAFVEERCGLALDTSEIERLTDSTEGWAAAIQLATIGLGPGKTLAVDEISGRHQAIGQFLADNVLENLDPRLSGFLLDICVAERICGELATALSDRPDAQAMLDDIVRQDLFIDRLGGDTDWYRIHHLFADFLRRRLERDNPTRKRELHLRAAQWFSDRMQLSEAVDHAMAAGDTELAVEIVERQGMRLLDRGLSASLMALIDKLPTTLSRTRPRLQVAIAAAQILTRHADLARSALARVDSALSFSSLKPAESSDLQMKADVLRAVFAIFADDVADVHALVGPALEQAAELPQWQVSAAAGADVYASIHTFDLAGALRRQSWAEQYQKESRGPFGVMFAHCFAGLSAHELLEIDTAEMHFETAISVAETIGGRHSVPARLAGVLLGALRYEQGRLDEAEQLLDAGAALGSEFALVDFMIATYATGGRVKAIRGEFFSAKERFDVGQEAAVRFRLPRLEARMRNEQARLGIPASAPDGAPAAPVALDDLSGIAVETAELDESTAIRWLLRRGNTDRLAAAVERAEALHAHTAQHIRPRAHLASGLLLVSALDAAKRRDEASAALSPLLQTGAECGIPRVFIDEGPRLIQVIAGIASEPARLQLGPVVKDFITTILDDGLPLPTWPA
ncbi:serine/threonine-protein kinase [Mycolicibacterium sp. CBMA 234]|uniref:serine/threonine-protein kinase n=1 Tax=Mycolicibacterium sp. CBMA 234 TaxID=1918495 RepID=UPI0013916EBE|nr:serine/threonine-protein kinase [Mycolicibacterium sp. CBMA 234]